MKALHRIFPALFVLASGALFAAPHNGAVLRMLQSDPAHVCENPANPAAKADNALRHDDPQGDPRFAGLAAESQQLLLEIRSKHAEFLSLAGDMPVDRHVIVLKDVDYVEFEGAVQSERIVAAIRYKENSDELRCVIFDSLERSHSAPQLWTRRLVRVSFTDALRVDFETRRENLQEAVNLYELDQGRRLRILRRIVSELRGVAYVLDRKIPELDTKLRDRRLL